jgi:valyl-tRNA synthetase
LLHPICPFQSEEIWQTLPGNKERWQEKGYTFCAQAPYPQPDAQWADKDAAQHMEWLQNAITLIRNTRQESGLPAQKKVPVHVVVTDAKVNEVLQGMRVELKRLALLTELHFETAASFQAPKYAATNSASNFDIVIPLEGLIDLEAERVRLEKEIAKVQKEASGLSGRLNNKKFVDKAPAEVVAQAQTQHSELQEKLERLQASLKRVS